MFSSSSPFSLANSVRTSLSEVSLKDLLAFLLFFFDGSLRDFLVLLKEYGFTSADHFAIRITVDIRKFYSFKVKWCLLVLSFHFPFSVLPLIKFVMIVS